MKHTIGQTLFAALLVCLLLSQSAFAGEQILQGELLPDLIMDTRVDIPIRDRFPTITVEGLNPDPEMVKRILIPNQSPQSENESNSSEDPYDVTGRTRSYTFSDKSYLSVSGTRVYYGTDCKC